MITVVLAHVIKAILITIRLKTYSILGPGSVMMNKRPEHLYMHMKNYVWCMCIYEFVYINMDPANKFCVNGFGTRVETNKAREIFAHEKNPHVLYAMHVNYICFETKYR